MRYGSVCSGIEAASVAWESLGWEPAWFAEIEPFPSAVLAHHWPHVANLGDMTRIAALIADNQIEAPDVLVGGTPCQAFSIAGLRKGLSDSRGQLTLSYVELANEIDKKRRERGEPESVIVWENVPGVLNSRDNAFGCFLAGLAGERDELQPPGGRWTNAGCVSGPQRDIAWRVLDAEFFGVAQRRRRVFVIASARTDLNSAKILFECDGVRRDTPPSRETQTETTGTTGKRANSGSHWGNPAAPHPTLNQSNNTGGIGLSNQEIFSQRGSGLVSDTYSDIARTLLAKSNDSVAEDLDTYVLAYGGGNTSGSIDVATACTAHGVRLDFDTETFAVHGTQDPDTSRELAHTLGRNYGQENACISFSYKDDGGDAIENLSPTIRAGNHNTSHANSGQPPAIALAGNTIGRSPCNGGNGTGYNQEICYTLTKTDIHGVVANARVRRLTPVECERLQGFPDNHTQIPWRGKDAADCPDGPRYRAIGNSMAVPVMRWIGQRIAAVLPVKKLTPQTKKTQVVSFSGGRSSAYLVYLMEQRRAAGEDVHYLFMDTGAEHPKTYEFIRNVVKYWNIPLICLRIVVNPVLGQANSYRVVPLGEIKQDLQPWRDICAKYGTPYVHGAFCTRTLKKDVFKRYCRDNFDEYHTWIGIRVDELKRLKPREGVSYLADISDFDKQDVLNWWKQQPFDLKIPEHLGNCVFCVKKGVNKIALAARDEPEMAAEFWQLITSPDVRIVERRQQENKIMYRNNNSLESVIALFSGYSREELAATIRNRGGEESGSCTESCEFISAEDITEETTEGQGEQIVVEARSCFGGSNTPTPLRNLWKTPPEIFAALNAEFIFQLDAAASAYNALCHKFITAEQNTLITPWSDYLSTGYVWLNPPYSNIAPFIRKAAEENKNHQIGTVALLPADTSVGWFREAIQTASEVRFITGGRLSFINPETGKPVNGNNKGSLLVIWHPYPRTHCRFTTVERDELLNFGKKFLSRLGAA